MKRIPEGRTAEKILKLTLTGLEQWENRRLAVDDFLDSEPVTRSGQRRTVSSLLFSYFRHKPLIDALIRKFTARVGQRERRLLSIATAQILFHNSLAAESAINIAVETAKSYGGRATAGFVNAVLRRIRRTDIAAFKATLPPWAQAGVPEKLYQHWQKKFSPEQFAGLLKNLQHEAKLYFRRCRHLTKAELDEVQATALSLPWLQDFTFYSCAAPAKLFATDWLRQGKIYIQDPATALSLSLIDFHRPIALAIDLCAAPGGKSLMIAEKLPPGAKLIALDRSEKRQQLTRINFTNHGFAHHVIKVGSATKTQFAPRSFDLVFIDAPCSNSGVFHRRPDAMWRWSENQNRALTKLQRQILEHGFKLLKPGGELIYSTCSIEPEENNLLVKAFADMTPGAQLAAEAALLPGAEHDGAYAAKLVRH